MNALIAIFGFAISGLVLAGPIAVQKGHPQHLNASAGTAKASAMKNKVIIKDPIFHAPHKVKVVRKKKKRRQRVHKESLQFFETLAIDGRRSKPRVDFSMPTIKVRRVDETYFFEVREKIVESE